MVAALYLKHFSEGSETPHTVRVLTDSTAAKGAVTRSGSGSRMKHLKANTLFVQQYIKSKEVAIAKVGTEENVADIGTKVLDNNRILQLLTLMGCVLCTEGYTDDHKDGIVRTGHKLIEDTDLFSTFLQELTLSQAFESQVSKHYVVFTLLFILVIQGVIRILEMMYRRWRRYIDGGRVEGNWG